MKFNAAAASFIGALAFGWSPVAVAHDYKLPEIHATITASKRWVAVSPSLLKDYNKQYHERFPTNKSQYIAGFTRGTVDPDDGFGDNYITISRIPGEISFTPEEFAAAFAGTLKVQKPDLERQLSDQLKSIDYQYVHCESDLGAVVLDSCITLPSGNKKISRTYMIPTKGAVIALNVYSNPADAEEVFEEAQGIVTSLSLPNDVKVSKEWKEELKQVFTRKEQSQ